MEKQTGQIPIQTAADVKTTFLAQLATIRGGEAKPELTSTPLAILDAAMALIREGGADGFSVRRVAERAGLSLAALQYHFPARADLIREMIEHRIDLYHRSLIALLGDLSDDPRTAFLRTVDFALDDAGSAEARSFWPYLWSLSNTDQDACLALDRYMRAYRELFALLIRRLEPHIAEDDALRRGALLSVMIDGTMIIAGEGRPRDPRLVGLGDLVRSTAYSIATERLHRSTTHLRRLPIGGHDRLPHIERWLTHRFERAPAGGEHE